MKMESSLLIRRYQPEEKRYTEVSVTGVFCTATDGILADKSGFSASGSLIVRIPEDIQEPIACGDEISHDGGVSWFTVAEIRDNRKNISSLSHRKVIGKR